MRARLRLAGSEIWGGGVVDGVAHSRAWRFDRFLLDVPNGGLFRLTPEGAREPVVIGSRALDVLTTLVARAGELVRKQDLIDAVWPGVSVEEKNLTVQISALRRALDDGRIGESCIQTVPGRGYRLAVKASPALTAPALPSAAAPSSPSAAGWQSGRWGIAALLTTLAVTGAVALGIASAPRVRTPASPPRLSLVVLPFGNLGRDTEDDRLAREVTEDITNDLSRVPGITIIAAPSGQDSDADPRKVGIVAGVRYVLAGSVHRVSEGLRVSARLVSSETGARLWSERLEQGVGGDGEAVIVRRLGQAVTVAMVDTESARSKQERPANPDAFDLVLQARSLAMHNMGQRERATRVLLMEQAVQLDPNSIMALTELAGELIIRVNTYLDAGPETLERAAALVRQAAAVNPNHVAVLYSTAFLLLAQGRTAAAIAAYRRLLDEHPSAAFAYNELGLSLIYAGRSEEALQMVETGIRRDPRHPRISGRYGTMGYASLLIERDEDAITWTQRALAANPSEHPFMRANFNFRLAAAHARLGQFDLARHALAEANQIWPYDTVRMHWPEDPDSAVYAAQIARWQAGLRLAGHRDHAEEDADFGTVSEPALRGELAGLTPTSVPGAKLIRTAELERLLAARKLLVIDPLMYSWGRSIPGAIGLRFVGVGGSISDRTQERLRRKVQSLTHGDLSAPIVAVGFNSERFDGRNLALRLAALGYTELYWYRGGREVMGGCRPARDGHRRARLVGPRRRS